MATGTRERIVTAAGELFARDGIRATGVNAIIGAAGVAKATFYRHFSSKDDVVAAWLEASFGDRVVDMLDAAEASAATPAGRIDALLDDLTARIEKPDFAGFPFIIAAMELPDAPSEVRVIVLRQLDDARAVLEELAAAAGSPDPGASAAAIQLLLLGLLVRVRAEPERRVEIGHVARDTARRLLAAPPGASGSPAPGSPAP